MAPAQAAASMEEGNSRMANYLLSHLYKGMVLIPFSFLILNIVQQSHAQGYAAYAGLPVQSINGEGIAGNGASSASELNGADDAVKSATALGSNIRKAPIAPLAPPRVPLFAPDSQQPEGALNAEQSPLSSVNYSYRPVPPPVRRDERSEGECHFDATKWQMHAQSAAANAVMFDRTSGISCDQCLEKCTKFQDHSTEWICRTVTYDHRWKICDLFAVNGTEKPYYLLDYQGRDYFEYMAALPPTDLEMLGFSKKAARDSASVSYDQQVNTVTAAPSNSRAKISSKSSESSEEEREGLGIKQCSCPCKALAQLTAQKNAPLAINKGKEEEAAIEKAQSQTNSSEASGSNDRNIAGKINSGIESASASEPLPLPITSSISGENAHHLDGQHQPLPVILPESTSVGPSTDASSTASTETPHRLFPELAQPEEQISTGTETTDSSTATTQSSSSSASSDNDLLMAMYTHSPISSSKNLSAFIASIDAAQTNVSPAPIQSAISAEQNQNLESSNFNTADSHRSSSASNDSSASSSSSLTSSFSSETIITTSNSSSSSSSFEELTSNSSSSSSSTGDIRKAFASKTFQPYKEVHVPFRKTLEKVSRVGMRQFGEEGKPAERKPSPKVTTQSACPRANQVAHYVEIRGRIATIKGGSKERIEGIKEAQECMDACDNPAKLPFCNSAQLSDNSCQLSSASANHSAPNAFAVVPRSAQESSKYLEKICLDASLIKGEKHRIFTAIPGYILVGHVQEVSNAASLSECLKTCLLAETEYGFKCKSLMYYPSDQDQNCLMNSESRHTQSDVFVPEEQNVNMLYVDIEHQRQKVPLPLPLPEDEQRRFRDSPMDVTAHERAWTRWSKCLKSGIEFRHRYLKCKEAKDVRKCPKESVPCNRMPTLRIQRIWQPEFGNNAISSSRLKAKHGKVSDCLAVRDALGVKRCPYGMRWNGSKREFCTQPIDC